MMLLFGGTGKVTRNVTPKVTRAAPPVFSRDTQGKIGLSLFELKSPGIQAGKESVVRKHGITMDGFDEERST